MTIPPGDELHAILRRLRLRLYVVTLAPWAPLGVGLTFLVPFALMRMPFTVAAVIASVALGIILVAAAGIWVRVSSLTRIGAIVDHQCGLQDRVVTALQFVDASDDIASFILRDALRHLRTVAPARVFPFQPRRIGGGLAALLVIAAGGFALPSRAISEFPRMPAHAARGPAADDAPANGEVAAIENASTNPNNHANETTRNTPGTQATPSSQIAPMPDANPAVSPPPAGGSGTAPGRAHGPSSGAAGEGEARTAAAGAALSGTARVGGAGSGQAGTAVETRLMDSGAATVAMHRAETAIARGQVPARHRAYVHDYFAALNIGIAR